MVLKRFSIEVMVLLGLSLLAAFFLEQRTHNLSWFGRWPTATTSAEDAYRMISKEGDPPFIGIGEVISSYRQKQAVFLDARSSKDFSEGRIPGARSLPYYELEPYQEKALLGLQSDSLLILYCEGIGCELSLYLGRELKGAGYNNLRIFYGGFPEWKNAGLPVEK